MAQPVGDDAGSQTSADKTQSQPQSDKTPLALEAIQNELKGIARAIKAQKDEADAKRKDEREASDLKAQWEMARWTENAVYVAIGALILTGVGIWLIWGTLVHTRTAANAATATVAEARAATAAANAANAEAKRHADLAENSFKRLERPYLLIEINFLQLQPPPKIKPYIEYRFVNHGKTPAIFKSIFLELRPIAEMQFVNGTPRIPMGAPEKSWYEVLPQGGGIGKRKIEVLNSSQGEKIDPNASMALHGRLTYEDPTRVLHSHHFVLVRQAGRFCLEYSEHRSEYPKDHET